LFEQLFEKQVDVGGNSKYDPETAMIDNYTDFWHFYVQEHSKPATRLLHFIGTSLGLVLLVWFIATGRWYFFPLFLVVGYAFAWFAHFVVEKNRPATFKYPLWSFISDFRMIWYMLTGRMSREVERASSRKFSPY
jgi:hypothetical protein